nr:immunoglobulin light chain junction region [Macaca mulatta]MOY06827.1 immunoglobulin light chain junction region [Macaca mulatta]MOY07074.1 immunoglobulin light chain junction region [Macaca mulatta]MOY07393.1 immunoglobulin light chain junction region [Macaca mulatta]MOY08035.1 immunoglobulin light chain junction region [Macaca mulatta]
DYYCVVWHNNAWVF